jgi:ribonuclease-3
MSDTKAIDDLLHSLGITFSRKDLLREALTHRSYVNEHSEADLVDNERLEFLGDAVLDFIVGEMLFLRFPTMLEGDLTRLRAALVNTESLALMATQLGLGTALRMGKGEDASGGRRRPNNLAGVVEAFLGALYLDQGLEALRSFVTPYLEDRLKQVLEEASDKDARSLLQEWSQATLNLTPQYKITGSAGPDHEKQFTVEASIGGKIVGRGVGRSKQAASQAAARDALTNMKPNE